MRQRTAGTGWQLQLSGTGLRLGPETQLAKPFLSALSMRDFITLLASGWVPTGLAWGHGAAHLHAGSDSPYTQGVLTKNAEMPGPTRAVNLARSRAQQALMGSLRTCRATGATGMTITIDRQRQRCYRGGEVGTQRHMWSLRMRSAPASCATETALCRSRPPDN